MTRSALVCAPLPPEFDRESGSRRIFDCVELLLAAGYHVTFAAREAPTGERYIKLLQQRGVAVYTGFDLRLERLVEVSRPDLAVLAFWHVGEALLPLLRKVSPATRV